MRALTTRTQEPSPFACFRLGTLFAGALLLSAACNRPAEEPSANLLATAVSSTLTAQPVVEPTSTQPAETPVPEVDEDTREPTETPKETESTPTDEIAPTPSNTPIPLKPGDPRLGLNLSDPDYVDDFGENRWFPISDEDKTFAWEDGRLRVTDHKADGVVWWTTTSLPAENAYAEVSAEIESCANGDSHGLGVRVGGDNFDRGYTLEISCDGAWRVRKFIAFDEIPAILRDWTESDMIQAGPDASNQIGFLANGDQLFAFVNGELLDTVPIEDSDHTSGVPSLFANASQSADLTVRFDDFRLWHLPP